MKSNEIVYVKKLYENLIEIYFMMAKKADQSKQEDGELIWKNKVSKWIISFLMQLICFIIVSGLDRATHHSYDQASAQNPYR